MNLYDVARGRKPGFFSETGKLRRYAGRDILLNHATVAADRQDGIVFVLSTFTSDEGVARLKTMHLPTLCQSCKRPIDSSRRDVWVRRTQFFKHVIGRQRTAIADQNSQNLLLHLLAPHAHKSLMIRKFFEGYMLCYNITKMIFWNGCEPECALPTVFTRITDEPISDTICPLVGYDHGPRDMIAWADRY